jgi:hypothetical protein
MDNNKIDCTELETMVKYYNDRDEHEKHLKGYMYDSLVYRYKYVREKLAELEYREQGTVGNDYKSLPFYRDSAERDIMRFIQILDEAIGEHD